MTAERILAAFPRLSALVVGDICLDRWCSYDPAESDPSRETGIPRIGVVSTQITPGAGGTVANNLAALGAGRVAVLGAIGDDGFGFELSRALRLRRIEPDLLITSADVHTFTYTKVINASTGIEDRPRLDFINTRPLAPDVERAVIERLNASAGEFDVIFVSDQAETNAGGVVTNGVRQWLAQWRTAYPDKIVWVDSRMRSDRFRKAIVKPNLQEAEECCRRLFSRVDFEALRRHIDTDLLFVTHGERGVLVVEPGSESWVETRPVENPVDICGAGDSFSAGAGLALAATRLPVAAARIGNLVASVTIMKKGTGTASPDEVLAAEKRLQT